MRRLILIIAAFAGVLLHTGVAQAAPVLHLSGWKASAGKPETFTITRIGGNGAATIAFKTIDGTAAAPVDYTATSLTISWAKGQTTATVTVPTFVNLAKAGQNISFTASITSNGAASSATGLIVEPPAPAPAPPTVVWTHCANEGETCYIVGTANVRYGRDPTWLTRSVTGSILCSYLIWTDPVPWEGKTCETDGTVAAPAPTPVPTPTPTPTPTPVPVPTGNWVSAPLAIDGYACNKLQANTTNIGSCGSGVVMKVLAGPVMSKDVIPVPMWLLQFYSDRSGQFPANDLSDAGLQSWFSESALQGIAPAP